jgi:hypothetical protein
MVRDAREDLRQRPALGQAQPSRERQAVRDDDHVLVGVGVRNRIERLADARSHLVDALALRRARVHRVAPARNSPIRAIPLVCKQQARAGK